MKSHILVIDDDETQRLILKKHLEQNYKATVLTDSHDILDIINDTLHNFDIIILDIVMPHINGLDILDHIHKMNSNVPVIMLTGEKNPKTVVDAMRRGATDFLNKPIDPQRLKVSIENALKLGALHREVHRLKGNKTGTSSFDTLIGHATGLAPTISMGHKAAKSDIPVLITGETGVGKEVFARALHGESDRAGYPFIAVNCGAIPENLIESILFGHEKGAFTGAVAKSLGHFREAEHGTIFLDEIGELPLDAQVKLLRVLQQKEIQPVGSSKLIPIDIRVISATHRDLSKDVMDNRFREDLFFRLNVLQIEIPSLKERSEDILPLILHFIERFAVQENLDVKSISDTALAKLTQYNWPGNIRELENVIHRAMVLSEQAEIDEQSIIFSGHGTAPFPDTTPSHPLTPVQNQDKTSISLLDTQNNFKPFDEIEIDVIKAALDYHKQNMTHTSKALGIAKSTLYRKLSNAADTLKVD